MDIQLFDNSLKIKTKKATLAVDPRTGIAKFDADAIIALGKDIDTTRINNFRLIIEKAGEYEVSGLKISGFKTENGMVFILSTDSTNTLLASASSLEKISADKIGECQIAIINADTIPNQTVITAIEPRIVVLYGEKSKDAAKNLGKETSMSSKASFPEDKLPEELNVLVLG